MFGHPQDQNANKLIAEFGLNYAKQRFPLGGLNRKDVFEANPELIMSQIEIMIKFRAQPTNSPAYQQYMDQLKGGCCGDLSYITRTAIKDKFPLASVEVVDLSHHQLLIIGRRKNSDPDRISDWVCPQNEPASYFLDVWAGEFYPVADYMEKQLFEPGIPFYECGADGIFKLSNDHHLSGTPKIVPNTNHYRINEKASIAALLVLNLHGQNKTYEIVSIGENNASVLKKA
jgi:hypothetical protein